ncbi:hypothetical protein M514_06660 [Trichuris suis]|uniref:Uncharacterized protein n=1 Tax=Trichuris suis TaxID=68888 RepID=A0A085M5G7_9BILA|nr:hypothetical protein M513_06660 [Trichuris suis]KFD69003.1 hypothetical protein M514_06660 [Trichuris suis]
MEAFLSLFRMALVYGEMMINKTINEGYPIWHHADWMLSYCAFCAISAAFVKAGKIVPLFLAVKAEVFNLVA